MRLAELAGLSLGSLLVVGILTAAAQKKEDMAAVTRAVRSGQGSLGRLLMDQDTYQEVQTAMILVQRALEEHRAAATDHDSAVVSSERAKYTEAIPGVSRAIISGDPDKGAYRAFTKFAPGVAHPMHSHPNEIWLVVIKGAYIHKPEKGEEVRVEAGCAFHIPAGEKHASSGDAKEGVVMFEESNEKFGMDLVDKDKKEKK